MTSEKFTEWLKARKEKPTSIKELRTLYKIASAEENLEKPEPEMTKEELELLKTLLKRADKAIYKKISEYFKKQDETETESAYALWHDVMHLEIKLILGIYDQYLIKEEPKNE